MDPTETLRRLRNIMAAFDAEDATPMSTADTERLASLGEEFVNTFEDLDEWLSKGGFLPADWQQAPPANPCPYTHAHTRHFCGYNTCRNS